MKFTLKRLIIYDKYRCVICRYTRQGRCRNMINIEKVKLDKNAVKDFLKKLKRIRLNTRFKSILHKMLLSFGLVIFFTLLIIGVAIYSSNHASRSTNYLMQDRLPIMIKMEDIAGNYFKRTSVVYEYLLTGDDEGFDTFRALSNESTLAERDLLEMYENEELERIIERSAKWTEDVNNRVVNTYAVGQEDLAISTMKSIDHTTTDLSNF